MCACSCATGVTTSFEGTDKATAAFSTAGQVKKLNSFSLVSLYFQAKEQFFNVVSPPAHMCQSEAHGKASAARRHRLPSSVFTCLRQLCGVTDAQLWGPIAAVCVCD